MSTAEFGRAVDILVSEQFHGQLNISGGETTLHPDLTQIVTYASTNLPSARMAIFTNGDWVGGQGWRRRLSRLLGKPNVLVRFSLDRQHAEGKARALGVRPTKALIREIEGERFAKAQAFLTACRDENARPGIHFDFAFKGTLEEANQYLRSLGPVPIYLIEFQKNPGKRPKRMGFLAIDLDESGQVRVYLTLGHIPGAEALGGLETLASALEANRRAIRPASPWDAAR